MAHRPMMPEDVRRGFIPGVKMCEHRTMLPHCSRYSVRHSYVEAYFCLDCGNRWTADEWEYGEPIRSFLAQLGDA